MHRDQVGLFHRLADELGDGAENERVADPMEAIFPQPVGRRDLLVDRIRPNVVGQGLVEGRIEVCDAPDVGEFLHACADDF